jgi:hypothetical protein
VHQYGRGLHRTYSVVLQLPGHAVRAVVPDGRVQVQTLSCSRHSHAVQLHRTMAPCVTRELVYRANTLTVQLLWEPSMSTCTFTLLVAGPDWATARSYLNSAVTAG